MKYEKYVTLIRHLETSALTNRKFYEYKVLSLALLGYAYFLGLIVLFLILPLILIAGLIIVPGEVLRVLLLAAKLWWLLVPATGVYFGFLGGAMKALFAKFPEPEARVLSRTEAPELFHFIGEAASALRSKFPRRVLLTDEFNAAVVTVPRFGLFGQKVYMMVGLPLMQALSPEQFKAVLAHELGHISGKHGGFGKWAYQLHESWGRFIDSQEQNQHKLAAFYEKFVNWFFPYFRAYSFVLMREHEKEADIYASELTGSQALAEALITLDVRGTELQQVFWKSIHEENLINEEPSKDIFSRMMSWLREPDSAQSSDILKKALEVPTDYNDSHPSLADRLLLLKFRTDDYQLPLPPKPDRSAMDAFLGRHAEVLIREFDEKWDKQIAGDWKTRYDHHQERTKRLGELDARGSDEHLSAEEMLEKAGIMIEQKGHAEALPILEQTVKLYPENAEANYTCGTVRLVTGDESGLEMLNRSMTLDPKWKYSASDVAFQFLRSRGRLQEAAVYAEHIENEQETFQKAQAERSGIFAKDKFEVHSLDQATVDGIIAKLEYFEEITAMYLVRKKLQYMPEIPYHVLFIDLRKPKTFGNKDLKVHEILKIAVDRMKDYEVNFIAVLGKTYGEMKPDLEKIEGARIFERQ